MAENARINHASLKGLGWRRRAGELILAKLDDIFPGHGIGMADAVRDLPIGKRQMVEVARAFTVTKDPLRLVILDEPTSSLDSHTAGQLLSFVRRVVADGASCILISHLLGEVLKTSDRIVVMRDGKVVAADVTAAFDRDKLVLAMGAAGSNARGDAAVSPRPGDVVVPRSRSWHRSISLSASPEDPRDPLLGDVKKPLSARVSCSASGASVASVVWATKIWQATDPAQISRKR